ncbi:unnamed protein product [Calypogeia fissa]
MQEHIISGNDDLNKMWWHRPNDDAFLNLVLYMMPRGVLGILAFDVGKGSLKLLDVQGRREQNPEGYNLSTILEVCDANLLMIDIARTYESDPTTTVAHPTHDEITILKIDLVRVSTCIGVGEGPSC